MTSGVLSKVPPVAPVWKVHARVRFFTLFVLIWVNVENRIPPGSPPWFAQSRPGFCTRGPAGAPCLAGAPCPPTPLCVRSAAASTIIDVVRKLFILLTGLADL